MWQKSILGQIFLLCVTILAEPEPDPEPAAPMLHHTLTTNPQNLESVLSSIDERLRALDGLYAMRFAAPRWEISLEASNRKLETLESKLARIETVLELRVDKLTESLGSKSLKDELSKDQLSRKIDVIYERLNHRMSFMESRIENNIAKFQSSLDTTLTRTNSHLELIEKTNSDVENDLLELGTAVDDSKVILQTLNSTLRVAGSNDSTDLELELQQLGNLTQKVLSTCEDISTRSRNVEDLSRKSMDLVNATRRELAEGVKSVKAAANRRITCPPSTQDGAVDYLIEKVDSMGRKNEGNYQKLDTTIERLHMRQQLYQESCHRLQLTEPQIENRIADILQKILEWQENRTQSTDKNYESLLEILKSHHNYVQRTVGQTSNTVQRLSERMTNDVKSIFANNPASEKIDSIIASLQDLQDEFQELNATITSTHQLTPLQSQVLLNNTAAILKTIQHLNENMSTIIDKLSDYYRNMAAETYEPETDVSSSILNIFNMTEADLKRVAGQNVVSPKEMVQPDGVILGNDTDVLKATIVLDREPENKLLGLGDRNNTN